MNLALVGALLQAYTRYWLGQKLSRIGLGRLNIKYLIMQRKVKFLNICASQTITFYVVFLLQFHCNNDSACMLKAVFLTSNSAFSATNLVGEKIRLILNVQFRVVLLYFLLYVLFIIFCVMLPIYLFISIFIYYGFKYNSHTNIQTIQTSELQCASSTATSLQSRHLTVTNG